MIYGIAELVESVTWLIDTNECDLVDSSCSETSVTESIFSQVLALNQKDCISELSEKILP